MYRLDPVSTCNLTFSGILLCTVCIYRRIGVAYVLYVMDILSVASLRDERVSHNAAS